jgi:hypothetical protein
MKTPSSPIGYPDPSIGVGVHILNGMDHSKKYANFK